MRPAIAAIIGAFLAGGVQPVYGEGNPNEYYTWYLQTYSNLFLFHNAENFSVNSFD